MKWLHSIREKLVGGPPTGPQTTDEQHTADERQADLLKRDEERCEDPPAGPDSLSR